MVFGFLYFIDVNRQTIPLDDPPLSVTQRLAASMVPTKHAVRAPQTVHSLVRTSGLNCVTEGSNCFRKIVRVYERLPTTTLKLLKSHAAIVQSALIDISRFAVGVSRPEETWYRVDNLTEVCRCESALFFVLLAFIR